MKKTDEQIVATLLARVETWRKMYSKDYISRYFSIYDDEQTAVFNMLAKIPKTDALVASVKTLLAFLPVYDPSSAGSVRVEAVKTALREIEK